jgi:hydrogenase/urease accessory protein HupE
MFQLLGLLAVIASVLVAFRWGGRDEWIAACAFVLAMLVSRLVDQGDYAQTQINVMFVDAALLVGLVVLALRSDRFWPMWAAAFQLVGTTVHVASMTETGDYAWAYAVGLIFWSYPVLIALGVGSWLEGRPRRAAAMA